MNDNGTNDVSSAASPDETPTTQVPQPEQVSPSPADTWELPGGKPPESPTQELPGDKPEFPTRERPGEMPVAGPERDVWSGPRRPMDERHNNARAASTTAAAQGVRASTLVWGLILLVLGGLLLAVAMGTRIDLVTAAIVLLAGVGLALLVMALLPRRKPDNPAA